MPGKIERPSAAPLPKVERAAAAEAPVKAAAVSAQRPAADNRFSKEIINAGGAPAGSHVATTAAPDALWGAPRGNGDDAASIAALPPDQRAAKLAELQARKGEMQAKILARCTELEKKWEAAPPAEKEAALREYMRASRHLDPETRKQLMGKVDHAEQAHRRIDRLLEDRKDLPSSRHANAEEKAKRTQIAKELKAARREEKSNIKAATQVIDDAGLKVDRLAVTEQIIDPSAPKPGAAGSLLGMVKDFFSLNWLTSFVSNLMGNMVDAVTEKKAKEREQVLVRDLENQQAQQRLVNEREALKHLQTDIVKKRA
jgi:hypothetical protein